VIPPIFDQQIVFGQRVGPASLGMTRAQAIDALGPPSTDTAYGGTRSGLVYQKYGLNLVIDSDLVVQVTPMDGRYSTAAGIKVGGPLPPNAATDAKTRDANGVTTYCFADHTLLTVRSSDRAGASPACAVGTVCDIVLGGCTP
jgi:hypothetical protein